LQSNQEHRNILIKDSYCKRKQYSKPRTQSKAPNVLYNMANPSSNEDFETLPYERLQRWQKRLALVPNEFLYGTRRGHGGKQCTMEESMQKEVGMERKETE
jgi:hypothetical protein